MLTSALITIGLALSVSVVLAVLAQVLYRSVNIGLSSSAKHQQTTRLGIASVIAVIPWAVCGFVPFTASLALLICTCLLWAVTYPTITYLSNRHSSPDIDNYMDIAFGLYMSGAMSALYLAGGVITASVLALIEIAMLTLVISQWVYYAMYHGGINTNGMRIIRDTNTNEILEFARYYPWYGTLAVVLLIIGTVAGTFYLNIIAIAAPVCTDWQLIALATYLVAVSVLMFSGKRSPWRRCGLVEMYGFVSEYRRANAGYKANSARRMQSLRLSRHGDTGSGPHTILLVIGESATRDYMTVFNPHLDRDTTPWMTEARRTGDDGFVFFDHAYSCDMHTVQVLEKSLTESNQYNDKTFAGSCSIIDMAHALGYRVHWYSNQGHIGVYDTPVTLVAETSDVAKWTRQEVGKVQYDHVLLDFLDELDPSVNNLLVLHLKGSHFSYLNRYPTEATVWGEPGVQDNVLNYMNSLHYTDSVLKQAFDYCRNKLNLQAMIYCSDHGSVPERHRSPNFDGYGNTRIPLMVWGSPQYIAAHQARFDALRANDGRYWTNDLLYDLLAGVLDVEPCDEYNPSNSLADTAYRFQIDDLLTFSGRLRVADDHEPIPGVPV